MEFLLLAGSISSFLVRESDRYPIHFRLNSEALKVIGSGNPIETEQKLNFITTAAMRKTIQLLELSVWFTVVAAFLPNFANGKDDPRPNIIFMIADDLGWADVEFHGGNVPTPNLNKLLSEGVELRQHYVAPVCSPTRTGFMTGRYWSRFGVTTPTNKLALPFDTVTTASVLQGVGYETCITGKWHLGSRPGWGPNHFGFDHSYGSMAGGVTPWSHFYKKGDYSVTWHRNEKLLTEKGHVTDLLTN